MPQTTPPAAPQFKIYEGAAPSEVWADVRTVFTAAFSAAPYLEDPAELDTIASWGPEQLAQRGGRLVVAYMAGVVAGIALSHGIVDDQPWQKILWETTGPGRDVRAMSTPPENLVVIQELAVSAEHRGRGIAKECMRRLLADRPETHAVLGVYGQADAAYAMYRKWDFQELGTVEPRDGSTTVRVLGSPLPWPARRGNHRTP
ncbi:hypothetical protein ART_3939 [Arthrobacter sp. PAMC 25486]|uniref:GNAT family N-acetyltransferase n=1 Tax=Arthrobacter sp. PAMC 25486 TaxID=1494608 RepID=UPI00053623D5|nr:GNAT family N-acetyltransferase [Arthrobacter sp. PAMC 25486]AIY03538.1 hypothetical protein ART_3939 [Arthrobacter sp. PAMC 25486]